MLTESIPTVTKQPQKKAGRKRKIPKTAWAEIRRVCRQAKTKSQKGEAYRNLAKHYKVSESTISAIARKKKPYDK